MFPLEPLLTMLRLGCKSVAIVALRGAALRHQQKREIRNRIEKVVKQLLDVARHTLGTAAYLGSHGAL